MEVAFGIVDGLFVLILVVEMIRACPSLPPGMSTAILHALVLRSSSKKATDKQFGCSIGLLKIRLAQHPHNVDSCSGPRKDDPVVACSESVDRFFEAL